MKINRHITIESDLHDKILLLAKESKISYSEKISELIEEALSNKIKQSQLDYIQKKLNLLFSLVKQMYSDFNININNITDPQRSEALNEFFKKIKVSKLDD